jgi:hypothetical protein
LKPFQESEAGELEREEEGREFKYDIFDTL